MLLPLLILAAAPQLTVSPTAVKLDGKVVLSPIPDDEYLNFPALDVAVRGLPTGVQPELRFEAEVTFRVAKRVLFSLASAGRPAKELYVGASGPLAVQAQERSWPFVRIMASTTPAAVVSALRGDAGAALGVSLTVADDVTMGLVAQVMSAARDAGTTRQALVPAMVQSPRPSTPKGK